MGEGKGGETMVKRRRRGCRHSLRRHSPPVSVDAVLEVEHGQPPHVHIQHVVVEDVLQDKKKGGVGGGAEGGVYVAHRFKAQFD